MAGLEKRPSYTPRRQRERRAYQLVVAGSATGALGVITLILSIAGVLSLGIPVILLIVAAVCLYQLRGVTGSR